jgi:hypothetical protein
MLDLTDYFDYDENSATSGVLRYPLSLLEVGTHQLKLQAWDNANNLSTTEFTLEIRGSDAFGLEKVVNYPNPMRDETWFTCQVFGAVNAKIEVSVYTLRGRKLIELSQTVLADGFQNDIYWDGTDEFGQKLANGTYLYKVVYRSQGKEASKNRKIGHIAMSAANKPIVIVTGATKELAKPLHLPWQGPVLTYS